ncbi:MAG: 4-hydroxy-tetrahydrodipicolinate reductase [Phycisphaerae bacterium]|jgi:4-hydroxy-tetrahydrodipicolinate reductase
MNPLRLAIAGCTGRTGSAVLRLAAADPAFDVVAGLAHADDPRLGEDLGQLAGCAAMGRVVQAQCDVPCDALIEFTTPASCAQWAAWCGAKGVALVSGTTGLEPPHRSALESAAKRVPVLWAPNMSLGVNLLLELVARCAARLDENWDVEITELHHRHKVDAPSGTAKALLDAVCQARGTTPAEATVSGRSGQCGPRRSGEIGVHALRAGEIVGEHVVRFASAAESLILEHRAHSRDTFAAGALFAARWLIGRPPGLYAMRDVLGGVDGR